MKEGSLTMNSNSVCSLFGIRYPLVMGGISPAPDLGAAVSNAGGLGCIEGVTPPDTLRQHVQRFKELSDKPFSVNFPLAQGGPEQMAQKAQVVIEERVPVVITSAGNPKMMTGRLKENGIMVAHVVAGVYHARKAAEAGVDALIAEPTESGGYRGENEISMMVLIPAIRRALPDLPLVAAGAVADRAGMVAVTALGADGVQLGTRLVATREATYPDHVNKLILAADDTSTMSAEGRIRPRISKPEFAESVLGVSSKRTQMGQVAALIDEIVTVEDVFSELFDGGREQAQTVASWFDQVATPG
jgi:enoyl-[acyl-carrier protein] reductase II